MSETTNPIITEFARPYVEQRVFDHSEFGSSLLAEQEANRKSEEIDRLHRQEARANRTLTDKFLYFIGILP